MENGDGLLPLEKRGLALAAACECLSPFSERNSMRRRGAHLSVAVEPTGRRIALKLEKISDREVIEGQIPPEPNADEKRVLTYHNRRGTTSPLCESLRAKYSDYT